MFLLLVESNMTQGGLILTAGRVGSKKKTTTKTRKFRTTENTTENTPQNPQQPGARDHLETVCDETRPTYQATSPASIDPGFVKIGHVQLSQSVKSKATHTKYTADRLIK